MIKRILVALSALLLLSPAFAQSTTVQGAPVSGIPVNRSTLNRSATITAGNTFQTVLAAQSSGVQRQALTIENNNATDSCWITFGVLANGTKITAGNAAKGTSILLVAGGSYTRYFPYVPSDEIEATCATTSDTLYIELQ